jgi:hypothetical protein
MNASAARMSDRKELLKLRLRLPMLPTPLTTASAQGPSSDKGILDRMLQNFVSEAKKRYTKQFNMEPWQSKALVMRLLQTEIVAFARQNLQGSVHILTARDVLEKEIALQLPALKLEHNSAYGAHLAHESASSFFWRLYRDEGLDKLLSLEVRMQIGNALLFADWKETLEYQLMQELGANDLLLKLPPYLGDGFEIIPEECKATFSRFCDETLHAYLWDEADHMLTHYDALLRISPWCGLFTVMDTLVKVEPTPHTIAQDTLLRLQLTWLKLESNAEQLKTFVKYAKREQETQFKLGLAVVLLPPAAEALKLRAQRLLLQDETIDVETSVGYALSGLLLLAERVQADTGIKERVLDEVQRVLLETKHQTLRELTAPEVSSALATLAANTVRETAEKLFHTIWHSDNIQLFITMVLSARTGLFLTSQQWLISALANVLSKTLPRLMP